MKGKAGDFRYEVTLTGNSSKLEPKITGDKTQEIKIDFDSKITETTKVTATVKYTTMDGKITFTQDVTVMVTI